MGSPSPSPVCFTPSSPATSAEGLCLYNSGYLHWVRKHTHTSIVQHSHSSPTPTVEETRNSSFHSFAFFEATGRLSSVQHVLHFCFGNTTTLFTTENAGRFYFQRRFRGAQGSEIQTCSADSCSCSDRVQLFERFGEIYSMLR